MGFLEGFIAHSPPPAKMLLARFAMEGGGVALVEYLYVDEERLDTYFEQISSPVTYDKVPMWNAEIGMLGPKAGGTQQRFARPYTMHEKISKLIEHLEKEGLAGYGRAGRQDVAGGVGTKVFRIETCRAKRVFIPPNHGQPPGVGAFNIWISAVPRTIEEVRDILESKASSNWLTPGNLYLLEDDQRLDDQRDVPFMSSYSVVSFMFEEALEERESKGAPFRPYFDNLPHPRTTSEAKQKLFFNYFLLDPAEAFAQIGAQIGPERRIRTLYRVRAQFPEYEGALWQQYDLATFAYPIFIAEDTDPE